MFKSYGINPEINRGGINVCLNRSWMRVIPSEIKIVFGVFQWGMLIVIKKSDQFCWVYCVAILFLHFEKMRIFQAD